MIRLTKRPTPAILLASAAAWTLVLITKRANGIEPTQTDLGRYNHPEIKQTLLAETEGKCAYCESKILHAAFGDIEHILPKINDDSLRFSWDNLTIACDVCNTRKGVHTGIVDPYADEPSEYLGFAGDLAFSKDYAGLGHRTLTILDLNRPALRERRYERIRHVESVISTYLRERESDIAEVILADFRANELDGGSEFSAAVRSYVAVRVPEMLG